MTKRKAAPRSSTTESTSSTDESKIYLTGEIKEKPPRKKTKRAYELRWVVKKEYDPLNTPQLINLEQGDIYELREVFVKKNKDELTQHRRVYRKDYAKRPYVRESTKKRLEDPEVIAKRKNYSAREEVKQRKMALAKVNRIIRNKLKEKDPDLYVALRGSAAEVAGVQL